MARGIRTFVEQDVDVLARFGLIHRCAETELHRRGSRCTRLHEEMTLRAFGVSLLSPLANRRMLGGLVHLGDWKASTRPGSVFEYTIANQIAAFHGARIANLYDHCRDSRRNFPVTGSTPRSHRGHETHPQGNKDQNRPKIPLCGHRRPEASTLLVFLGWYDDLLRVLNVDGILAIAAGERVGFEF